MLIIARVPSYIISLDNSYIQYLTCVYTQSCCYKSIRFSSSSCWLNFKWNLYDTFVCTVSDIETVAELVKSICCDTALQSVELSVFASKQDLSSSALSLADSPIMKLLSCLAVEMIFTLSEMNCKWVINWLCFLLLSVTARWPLTNLLHKWKQIQGRSRRGS